ncbi:hypothetical protein NUACC21_54710 [Scytonema sp. NUACC21]
MVAKNHLLRLSVVLSTLVIGTLIDFTTPSAFASTNKNAQGQIAIATLANGKYQFCSQPDPKDWQDGAGVCFNFSKLGDRVDGYYGYPHSDRFVCIRGEINENAIAGKALELLWAVDSEPNISKSKLDWDSEGRLTLSQGNIIRSADGIDGTIHWVLFSNASLNVNGFYRYSAPRMTPPSQLCQWE